MAEATWYPAPTFKKRKSAIAAAVAVGIAAAGVGAAVHLLASDHQEAGPTTTDQHSQAASKTGVGWPGSARGNSGAGGKPTMATGVGGPRPSGMAPAVGASGDQPSREQRALLSDLRAVGVQLPKHRSPEASSDSVAAGKPGEATAETVATELPDQKRATRMGSQVCASAANAGFTGTVANLRGLNPGLSETDAVLVTVNSLFRLCPSRSPFGSSMLPTKPLPAGPSGEFLYRLLTLGLSAEKYPNIVGNGHAVCSVIASQRSFQDAEVYLTGVSPAIDAANSPAVAATAVQVFCPNRGAKIPPIR